MITAFIVDDEKLAREGIRLMLKKEDDVEVVGEAAERPSAMRAISKLTPQLLFLDVKVPDSDGFEILERCHRAIAAWSSSPPLTERYAVKASTPTPSTICSSRSGRNGYAKPYNGARIELTKNRSRTTPPSRSCRSRRTCGAGGQGSGSFSAVEGGGRRLDSVCRQLRPAACERPVLSGADDDERDRDPARRAQLRENPSSTIVNVDRLTEIRPSPHGDFQVVLENGRRCD
jgi:CheY-like chemotaxis protein